MKTKFLLLTVLTLLFILAACNPKSEPQADINTTPGSRADENGIIYVSYVEPADQTMAKQPANFTIAFPFPMDRESVEQALQISPDVEYSYRWSDTDLVITFIRGAQTGVYTVSLISPLTSIEGEEFPPTSWTINFQIPTSTPTHTPLPTRTPRPPTATPTVLSFSTIPPLFPTATPSYIRGATTTPIPTPSSSTAGFRLADLSIEEYIEMIQEVDQYAFANDVMGPGEKRHHYPHFQYPMKFAVLEALRTHPQTVYTQELEWKLALINATAELPESDDWILQALEDSLNQGILLPSEIDAYLKQFGFKVDSWWTEEDFIVPNLFGDGVTQSVFVINSDSKHNHIRSARDGILATLRGTEPGEYDLVKIYSRYDFAAGRWNSLHCPNSYITFIPDGNPVVCLAFVLGYSGQFPTDLYLLEWQGDHFINLAENLPPTDFDYLGYEFFPEEFPGVDILIEKYIWKDFRHGYSLIGEDFVMVYAAPPSDLIYELVTTGQFDKAVSEIETLTLENATDEILESGPYASGSQLFEFASSLVYAFNNQSAEAKKTLENLIASINEQEYPLMLQAVQDFNQIYHDAADIYAACHAALDILFPAYQETWGESETYRDPAIELCLSGAPIVAAINIINPGAATDLPTILQNSGIEVVQSQPIDVLNDGQRDWVFMTRIPEVDRLITFLAVQQNGKWFAQAIASSYPKFADLSASQISLAGLENPAVAILDGDHLNIVEVSIASEKVTFNTLLTEYATKFQFFRLDETFLYTIEFHVYDHLEAYELQMLEFQWNQQAKSFEKADLINALLFDREMTPNTFTTLQQIYQDVNGYYQVIDSLPENYERWDYYFDYRAKLLYAIGLAYQFNGDAANARQTFWRVWTEHPNTPYAIMARAKLIPVSP